MTMGMATNSVSSLCQLTKEASKTSRTSAGKRDGPSTAKSSNKRMKSTNYDPNKEDKEADYVPITNKASSNLLDENTWEEDPRVVAKHRKAFYLKAFPPQSGQRICQVSIKECLHPTMPTTNRTGSYQVCLGELASGHRDSYHAEWSRQDSTARLSSQPPNWEQVHSSVSC